MDELAGLSEEARKIALDRFRLIQPYLEENQSLKSVALAAGKSRKVVCVHLLFRCLLLICVPQGFTLHEVIHCLKEKP